MGRWPAALRRPGAHQRDKLILGPPLTPAPNISIWQIVLKKSFFANERNFLRPLMRSTLRDVSDHADFRKHDHEPWY
jgi:hypothetical protein